MPNVSSFGAQTDNAVVSGTVTDRQMVIPEVPPQGLMSIGPRQSPNYIKEPWNAQTSYVFYDVVKDGAGASYVATKPVVPAGTELTNEDYWFKWSDPNAQINELNEVVKTFNDRIAQNASAITAEVARATAAEATKAPTNHASEETIYGVGDAANYGHLRLADDATPMTSGANDGIAATPKMIATYIADTTPEAYGAKADGVTDDSAAINACINAHKNATINFKPGVVYAVADQIKMPFADTEKVSINGNGATIKAISNIPCFFNVGYDNSGKQFNEAGFKQFYVNDLTLISDDHNVGHAFDIALGCKDFQINNVFSFRTLNGVRIGQTTGSPNDTRIIGCLFFGQGSDVEGGVGITCNGADNNVSNTRIYGFQKGVVLNQGCNFSQVQVLLRWKDQRIDNFDPYVRNSEAFNTVYNKTVALENNKAFAHMTNFYCDSMHTFARISDGSTILMNDCIYYNSRSDVNCTIVDCENGTKRPYISIVNSEFNISKNDDSHGIKLVGETALSNYSNMDIHSNIIKNKNNLPYYDILMMNTHTRIEFKQTEYMFMGAAFAALPTYNVSVDVDINGHIYELFIDLTKHTISQKNAKSDNATYKFAYKLDEKTYTLLLFAKATSPGGTPYGKIERFYTSNINIFSPPNAANVTATMMNVSGLTEVTLKQNTMLQLT